MRTGAGHSGGRRERTPENCATASFGHRLDGWATATLNAGAIVAKAPDLRAFTALLGVDSDAVRTVQ